MTHNATPDNRELRLESSNVAHTGEYTLKVTATVASGLTADTEFKLEVIPKDCQQEIVRPDGTIPEQTYIIGSSKLALEPTWTSSVSTFVCPNKFVIYYEVGSNWIDPIPAE